MCEGVYMKIKSIVILLCMMILCGCQDVKNKDVESVIARLETNYKKTNNYILNLRHLKSKVIFRIFHSIVF